MEANALYVLLDNDCLVRVYQLFVATLMPSVTYYAQNYAGIIGWSLLAIYFFYIVPAYS